MSDWYPEGVDPATRDFFVENPELFLESFGSVQNQATGQLDPYRWDTISPDMTGTILSYFSNTPRMHAGTSFEKNHWLVVLAARQSTKSTTTAYGAYVKTAYTPGLDSLIIADRKDRADTLHQRVQILHDNVPEEVRALTKTATATRHLSFRHGGSASVETGKALGAGVGGSYGLLQLSECFLFDDLDRSLSFLLPAIQNRPDGLVVAEATPGTNREPSTDAWREMYRMGKRGEGRWLSVFYPFWASALCARPYSKDERLTNEELALLEEFGAKGLRPEHLMFRREVLDTDPQLRRHPELFRVFYPFDDVSCWINSAGSFIPQHALEARKHPLEDPLYVEDGVRVYQEPDPDAVYAIGVDPAGYGRDHAAFVIEEVWAEEASVVATFSDNCDPMTFNLLLARYGRKYNNALIGVERNGVGLGCIEALKLLRYNNLYYSPDRKPGIHKHSHDQMLEVTIDHLMDKVKIHCEILFNQLVDYRGDKAVEKSARADILNPGKKDAKRRDRHHFDLASAFMVAASVAPHVPVRFLPRADVLPRKVVPFNSLPYDEQQAYWRANKTPTKQASSYHRVGGYRRKR